MELSFEDNRQGEKLEGERLQGKKIQPVKPGEVRLAAMNLLARREHTRRELTRKLGKLFLKTAVISGGYLDEQVDAQVGGQMKDLIESEIDKLAHEGLQSDARLAEVLIRSRVSRGQGPVKIKMELRNKGVDDATIAIAFDSSEVDWFELVASVSIKRFGESLPTDMKEKAKRSRFLQQRGFGFDHISSLY
ncbi:MAG: regulatory protein RecX [Pseudomonadales bacterium]